MAGWGDMARRGQPSSVPVALQGIGQLDIESIGRGTIAGAYRRTAVREKSAAAVRHQADRSLEAGIAGVQLDLGGNRAGPRRHERAIAEPDVIGVGPSYGHCDVGAVVDAQVVEN